MSRQITDRYAKALFDLAQEENVLYPVYVSLRELSDLIKSSDELRLLLRNPLLSVDEKAGIIQRVFERQLPELLLKFLLFLNFKGRLNALAEVAGSFDALYLEKNNQVRVGLQTPYALDQEQAEMIKLKLNQICRKEVTLDVEIKPELLGGFRLLAEGTLYDGTIKTQLEQFRQKVSV